MQIEFINKTGAIFADDNVKRLIGIKINRLMP